jgi:hypothetical protein
MRDDFDERDDFDRDDDPPFPMVVTIAGIAWIVFGALIISGVLLLVVSAAGRRAAGGPVGGDPNVVALWAPGGCLALFAGAFIFVGVQSVRGTAPGTVGNGLGSIVYALFNVATVALLIQQRQFLAAAVGAIFVLGLIAAGVLALVGTSDYREWRRAKVRREERWPRRRRRYADDYEERSRRYDEEDEDRDRDERRRERTRDQDHEDSDRERYRPE